MFKVKNTATNAPSISLSRFWVTGQFWEKCTDPKMTLTCSRSNYPYTYVYIPWGAIFVRFLPTLGRFWVTQLFSGKVHQMTSKRPNAILGKVQRMTSKWQRYSCAYTILRAKFSFILLHGELFMSYAPFLGKVHRMTPNDLHVFKVKSIQYACYIHVWGPNFRLFFFLELWPFFLVYSTPNDLVMFKVKNTNKHAEPFLSYSPILGKVYRITSKRPWHIHGKKYPYANKIHPWGQVFLHFALRWSVFCFVFYLVMPLLGKVRWWPQNNLNIFKIKSTNIHTTYLTEAQMAQISGPSV